MANSEIETTSMSSRGQVVIPQNVREKLGLREGEKFIVIGKDSTILLKKIEMPSFKNFDRLIKRTQDFVKKKSLKESDLQEAIEKARR
jgi:AbrB family looped-hinge helix DNA binding protein